MSNLKMNCGYCGRKCSLDKDFCIPQDSVYVCKTCYEWQSKVSNLEAKILQKEIERHEEWLTGKEWKWECDRLKREQNQKSIEELEKVKKLLDDCYGYEHTSLYHFIQSKAEEKIDQRIKELKGEK